MFGNLSGPTLLVILFIVLLLFGAPKLPGLAKSLGQSMKILKKEVSGMNDDSTGNTGAGQATNVEQQGGAANGQNTGTVNPNNVDTPNGQNGSQGMSQGEGTTPNNS